MLFQANYCVVLICKTVLTIDIRGFEGVILVSRNEQNQKRKTITDSVKFQIIDAMLYY